MARLRQRPSTIPALPADVAEAPIQYDITSPRKTPRRSSWSTVCPVNDGPPCKNQRRHSSSIVCPVLAELIDSTPHKTQKNSPLSNDSTPSEPQKNSPWSNDSTPRVTQKNSTWSNDTTPRGTQKHSAWSNNSTPRITQRNSPWSTPRSTERRTSGEKQSLAAMLASPEATSLQSNISNPGSSNLWSTTRRRASGGQQSLLAVPPPIEGTSPQSTHSNQSTYSGSAVKKVLGVQLENEQGGTSSFDSEGTCSTTSSSGAKGNALRSRLRFGAVKQPEAARSNQYTKTEDGQVACPRQPLQRRKSKEEIDADFQDLFASSYPRSLPALKIDSSDSPRALTSIGSSDSPRADGKGQESNYAESIARQQDVKETFVSEDQGQSGENDAEQIGENQNSNYANRMKKAVRKISFMMKSVRGMSEALANTGDIDHDLQAQDIMASMDLQYQRRR